MGDPNNLLVSREFANDCKLKYGADPMRMIGAFADLYFEGKEPDGLTDAEMKLFSEKRAAVLETGVVE